MRIRIIKFRASIMEEQVIKQIAKEAGLPVSEFLRKSAFNKTVKKRLTPEELEAYLLLKKYANNFKNISNLFAKGDYPKLRELTIETAELIKQHLKKFK